MPVTEAALAEKLKAHFDASLCRAVDNSDGCGSKFQVLVVSEKFGGMALLERQRAVFACLEEEMKSIHALTMKAWTADQYEKKKAAGKLPF